MPKPLPVAVLEAKKESEDPLMGMEQAYAKLNAVFGGNARIVKTKYDCPDDLLRAFESVRFHDFQIVRFFVPYANCRRA
ncbi:MAG: hypothetical protein LBO00_03140 [Zoogloeaceae bacterium]|nr:hypothetical protein [Zoogloeaceae bacterium]